MIRNPSWRKICAITMFTAALVAGAVFQSDALVAAHSESGQTMGSTGDAGMDAQSKNRRPVQVMLELDMPPVAQIYAAQSVGAAGADQIAAATKAHLASVEASQLSLLTRLDQFGAEEIFRVQRVYNGIAVSIDQGQIGALLALPGVAGVHELTPMAPDHTRSVPSVHAPAAWTGIGGEPVIGTGVTIAIIDTGIDYLHANFDGTGNYAGNDSEVIGDVSGFPGPKVVAGYDFAGDAYDADPENPSYNPFPQPDPDPMDCYGHGTHVAGTAAGVGISADFTPASYDGPFDETTFSEVFRIGPGIAPAAKLIALKVFGCQGSSNLTARAIEWAVDPNQDGDFSDHVDVINMSLGSSYGSLTDPTVIASDNAAQIGVIVVASAGNAGDVYYVTGSPAVSTQAIGVAAISDHESTGVQAFAASFTSRGPRLGDAGLKPDISAPGTNIRSARSGAPGIDARLLSGTSMAAPHVAGAMALLREAYPDWRVEELKALVMNTARMQSPVPTFSTEQGDAFGPTRIGSGVLDLANALNTDVIAFNGDDPGAVKDLIRRTGGDRQQIQG